MMRCIMAVLAALVCASCAAVQAEVAKVEAKIAALAVPDIQAALDMAGAAKDLEAPYRARCYATLLKHAQAAQGPSPAVISPKGIVSAFEAAVEFRRKVQGGIGAIVPTDVHADCALLLVDVERFAVQLGARLALPGIP